MATKAKAKAKPTTAVHSDVLNMIKQNLDLASRMLPNADVDTYQRGNSPGPVDQYTKGSTSSIFDKVANPGNIAKVGNIAKSVKTKGGG